MELKKLIKCLDRYQAFTDLNNFDVAGVSCDSRRISDNFVFVAIKGAHDDGHIFIDQASKKGAKAVVLKVSEFKNIRLSEKISIIAVSDTKSALSKLSAEFYGNPSDKLKVIGITGTNGKTTITYLIEALLKESRRSPGVIGTVNYRFNDYINSSGNTTPGPDQLQLMLKEMLDAGVDYVAMEVSSHALDQGRTDAIRFHSAIFTNLTQDHLDYHKNLEDYFQAKTKLFRALSKQSSAIINIDDPWGKRLLELTKAHVITYGIENKAEVFAKEIKFDFPYTEFILKTSELETKLKTLLIGRHNVYNILAAIALGISEGIKIPDIKSAIERLDFVPGRLQRIETGQDFFCFVDYAHTEDALKNVINTLREITRKKIIVVFGCGGERDKTKRPKMGRIVTELADFAIITNDNPRSEEAQEIANNIKQGIKKDNYCIILDRKDAIKKSLSLAAGGDIVLVAGKGHEDYQILKNERIHFDDREVIRECLK